MNCLYIFFPFFLLGFWSFLDFQELFTYYRYVLQIFSPSQLSSVFVYCGWVFCLFVFVMYCIYFYVVRLSVFYCLFILSLCFSPKLTRNFLVFSSSTWIVLFVRYLIHLEFILLYGVSYRSDFTFCSKWLPCPDTIQK